jgi:hypothetical protein
VTSSWRRGSLKRATIHDTLPLRSGISRNTTVPGSPSDPIGAAFDPKRAVEPGRDGL